VSGVVLLTFTCSIPDRQRLMKAYERSPYPPMVRYTFFYQPVWLQGCRCCRQG
jgi:hypothetical protein